ncbi:MAG: hypothetical protein Q4G05_04745 [Clostridia bacterium]|nr:hypothetical protein [Clostridia bacterium]
MERNLFFTVGDKVYVEKLQTYFTVTSIKKYPKILSTLLSKRRKITLTAIETHKQLIVIQKYPSGDFVINQELCIEFSDRPKKTLHKVFDHDL